MKFVLGVFAGACIFLSTLEANPPASDDEGQKILLKVPSGTPVRLYLTKRLSSRAGTSVEGKILEPVFAFDHEVIPAGSVATGMITRVRPVSKWQRFRAIVNGDFTPLHTPWVEFDSLTLPSGSKLPIRSAEIMGLNSIYLEPSPKKNPGTKKNQNAPPTTPNYFPVFQIQLGHEESL